MTKRIVPILAVLLATLAVPTGASAQKQPARGTVPWAQREAAAYWGSTPCDGYVTVTVEALPPALEASENAAIGNPHIAAWSTWESPAGPDNKSPEPTTYTDCIVHLNKADWTGDQQPWGGEGRAVSLCVALIHEYGNLWGMREITVPKVNIMSREEPPTPAHCLD